jgi:hypothetical protein
VTVCFGLHAQVKARIAFALAREKIEEVPLRHEGDEAASGGKMGEIGEYDLLVADDAGDLVHLLVRQLEKLIEQAKLVHDLERRGMDRVAAEVAEEVGVLLQHHDIDAGASEQKPEHHPGRPAAGDGASRGDCFDSHAQASASAGAR